jgi:transposase InsO family protein
MPNPCGFTPAGWPCTPTQSAKDCRSRAMPTFRDEMLREFNRLRPNSLEEGTGKFLERIRERMRGFREIEARKRKRALGTRAPLAIPQGPNQRWSLDFLSDAFAEGRRFRILAVVDDFTRECLALIADTSLPGLRVMRELELLLRSADGWRCASPTMAPS